MTVIPKHPAEFNDEVLRLALEALDDLHGLDPLDTAIKVLDPFAGVGGVHKLAGPFIETWGVELMPRWAASHERTMVGDATMLPSEWAGNFDAVVTSPAYGNRMADHHEASDTCKRCDGSGAEPPTQMIPCKLCHGSKLSHRRSYRHYYGDDFLTSVPLESNAGAKAWGDAYRELHTRAWDEVHRVLRPGGRFVLNVKDHIRNHQRVHVARWHRRTVLDLGFTELWRWDIPLDGYGFGENRDARVPTEQVYVFERNA